MAGGVSKCSILPTRRLRSMGLVSKSLAPAWRAVFSSSARAWAVSAMMGMVAVSGSAFSQRMASQPSITGRLRSIKIRAGRNSVAMLTP